MTKASDTRNSRRAPAASDPRLEELGLEAGPDGLVGIALLRDASGKGYSYAKGEQPRCDAGRAIVLVSRGYAEPARD